MTDILNFTTHKPTEILIIGSLVLIGWFAHGLGRLTRLPRVTILLLIGVLAGPFVMDVIPHEVVQWLPNVTQIALAMVGFLLGGSFTKQEMLDSGPVVLGVSIGESLGAALLVFIAVYLVQGDLVMALLLAGIAPASDPAATLDVAHENQVRGILTRVLIGVVAIDDAWGVILFSLTLVTADALVGHGSAYGEIINGLWEIGGAGILGFVCGIPMAWISGRLKQGEPSILEAAGFVFICAGLAILMDVSYLIACIVLGATVANRAKQHARTFREIEGVSEPFLVVFFLLAGYEFNLAALKTLGLWGVAYVIARSAGLILGGNLAAKWCRAQPVVQSRIGWCLLPQAGVALGLALVVNERFPDVGQPILQLVIATTVIFEIIGPLVTKWHLKRAGEL